MSVMRLISPTKVARSASIEVLRGDYTTSNRSSSSSSIIGITINPNGRYAYVTLSWSDPAAGTAIREAHGSFSAEFDAEIYS